MRIQEVSKVTRTFILILIMGIGYFFWLLLFNSSPVETQLWLNNNIGWKYLIFAVYNLSLFITELFVLFPEIRRDKE